MNTDEKPPPLPYLPEHLLACQLCGPNTHLRLTDLHNMMRTSREFWGYVRALPREAQDNMWARALCNQMPEVTRRATAELPGLVKAVVGTRDINLYNLCVRNARICNLHANLPKSSSRLSRMILDLHNAYPVVKPGRPTDPATAKETLKFTLLLVEQTLEDMVFPGYRHKRHSHMPIHMAFCCAAIMVVFELVNNMWSSRDACFESPRLHQVTLDKAREIRERIMRVRGYKRHPHLVHLLGIAETCIENLRSGPLNSVQ